jgi:hypothetical protein
MPVYSLMYGLKLLMHSVGLLVLIMWLKRRSPAIQLLTEPSEPLNSSGITSLARSQTPSHDRAHSLTFDLSLARLSLLVEMVSNASMAFASTPQVFTVSAVFSELGAGFAPAVESVALEVYVEKVRQGNKADGSVPLEIGRLYSGLAVVQALS